MKRLDNFSAPFSRRRLPAVRHFKNYINISVRLGMESGYIANAGMGVAKMDGQKALPKRAN